MALGRGNWRTSSRGCRGWRRPIVRHCKSWRARPLGLRPFLPSFWSFFCSWRNVLHPLWPESDVSRPSGMEGFSRPCLSWESEMLVFTIVGPVDASDSEVSSSIVISEGVDGKSSEALCRLQSCWRPFSARCPTISPWIHAPS